MKNEFILLVLEDIKKQLELSVPFLACDAGSSFFDDSCKVCAARLKLNQLIDAVKLFNEYAKD